ncbi:family 10 glycosylhydrolase [Crocosphaera sp.]|uniref:family 10 glycosylhydrolase n=1 Tax=Crocosphaera sp. TaxID=2729996 RepID=UPI003F2767C4|nr:family 10 glycosylhydrolase [Crocosphaera sp.]
MSNNDNKKSSLFDFGCLVELFIFALIVGGSYWWLFIKNKYPLPPFIANNSVLIELSNKYPNLPIPIENAEKNTITSNKTPNSEPVITESQPSNNSELQKTPVEPNNNNSLEKQTNQTVKPEIQKPPEKILTPWEKKKIRGIYLSRYQVTNNANESTIRQRVRYYKSQGFNTIIHGVWGNGCTMYNSEVMQQTLGYNSCPNQFNPQWLNWLIDEAHKQGMEVHAYFEKGIKIDKNSPIFDKAIENKWLVPGVDRTYSNIEHYVLDVEVPEIANFFTNIVAEFVKKYPQIDAIQWDDYLGYHADLPGKVDRTDKLTQFTQKMISEAKKANPSVSFDISHHNPYWSKKYFAADWENWSIDRAFIQAYNEKNFKAELNYAKKYDGIAITDQQLHRLEELANNKNIDSVLVFPLSGKPEETASRVKHSFDQIKLNKP